MKTEQTATAAVGNVEGLPGNSQTTRVDQAEASKLILGNQRPLTPNTQHALPAIKRGQPTVTSGHRDDVTRILGHHLDLSATEGIHRDNALADPAGQIDSSLGHGHGRGQFGNELIWQDDAA